MMANSTQVPQPDDGLEVYHSPGVNSPMLSGTTPQTSYNWEPTEVPELKHEKERRSPDRSHTWVRGGYIALQWRTFWCIVVLSIFILAAAIGGGIGGGLAIQKAKSGTYGFPKSRATSASLTSVGPRATRT